MRTFLKQIYIIMFIKTPLSFFGILILTGFQILSAQIQKQDLYQIQKDISPERIENDIQKLANFGTRHTLSDTVSQTRGIGAARRWIFEEFQRISKDCGNCLEVFYQKNLVPKGTNARITKDVWVVNVVAIQKGKTHPNTYVLMSGDIDSRITDPNNYTDDAPGANDNASGMAGTLEAARVLSKHSFANSIVYTGLSGEEQGLFGGKGLAEYAKEKEWNLIAVLNNDMIGNIRGIDGIVSNTEFRIFSEPTPPNESERARKTRRFTGGEVDGISRQLARFVYSTTRKYLPLLQPKLIYRLDRFGRGGHHRPFNDEGFAGVRIMEAHENYIQQHQDIREENGIAYGDRLEYVDFDYAARLTAVNALTLASLAAAPDSPKNISIGGAVAPSTRLKWEKSEGAKSYKIYWRETTSPTWDYSREVGDVSAFTLENIIIDNYFFGLAAVGENGFESVVGFPNTTMN